MSPTASTLWKDAILSWNTVLIQNREASKCPVFSTNWYSLVEESDKKLIRRITKITDKWLAEVRVTVEQSCTVRAATFTLLKKAHVLWDCVYIVAQVATSIKTDHSHKQKGTALLNEMTSLWCSPFIGILACVYVSSIADEKATVKKLEDLFNEHLDITRNLVNLPKIFLWDELNVGAISAADKRSSLHCFAEEIFLPSLTSVCSESNRINCLKVFFTAPLIRRQRREAVVKAMYNRELESEGTSVWRELCISGDQDTKVFAAALLLHGEPGKHVLDFVNSFNTAQERRRAAFAQYAALQCSVLFAYCHHLKLTQKACQLFGLSAQQVLQERGLKTTAESELMQVRQILVESKKRFSEQLISLGKSHGCFQQQDLPIKE